MLPLWCEIVPCTESRYGERIRCRLMGDLGGIGPVLVAFSNRGGRKPRRLGKIGAAASEVGALGANPPAPARSLAIRPAAVAPSAAVFVPSMAACTAAEPPKVAAAPAAVSPAPTMTPAVCIAPCTPGLQGRGRPAETLHHGGRHEGNGEIEEDGEEARKRHDEREHQPVVHNDQVRADLDEIVRRDRHEQRVADRLDHDVHEANGHVPEQHGQRGDAELEAQAIAYRKRTGSL